MKVSEKIFECNFSSHRLNVSVWCSAQYNLGMPAKPSEVSPDNDMVSKTHNFGSSERVVEDDVIEHSENLEVKIRKTELIPPL